MVANLFWVVIGILAIIYYAAKEDFLATFEVVGTIAAVAGVLYLLGYLLENAPQVYEAVLVIGGIVAVMVFIGLKISDYASADKIIFPTDENDPIKMVSEFKGINIGEPKDDLTEDSNPDSGNNSDETKGS